MGEESIIFEIGERILKKNFNDAMRWAQLTFCEGDMDKFDPDYWLKYFDDSSCDGIVLGSGGYMAFHESDVPYHYQVKHPKHDDLFEYMVQECRRKGYSIICRTDGHAFHEDAYNAHPEWVSYTSDGQPQRHWTYPEVWVSCVLNDFGFKFMTDVHSELAEKYDIDGIFCNRWAGSGICYCPQCQKSFTEFSGHPIPLKLDFTHPASILYRKWHEAKLFELCETWDKAIIQKNANMRFIPNSTVGPNGHLNTKRLGDYSDILFCDRQSRHDIMPPWFNGRNGKELKAVMGEKPVGGIFSTGIEAKPRWKDSVQNDTELELWVSEAVANGLRPWFTKFCAQVFDDRWMPVVKNLYNKYKRWEPYLKDTKSRAETAVMFSQQTAREYAGNDTEILVEEPINGFYQALTEARIPFDMFDSYNIYLEALQRYKTIILPNIAVLSDKDCKEITKYVEQGGSIIATYETSLYNEKGEKRDNFGLADIFGIDSYNGKRINDISNSYITIDSDLKNICPILLKGFEQGGRMIGTVNRVDVGLKQNAQNPFNAVTPYPDLPMEEVYPRVEKADYEEVIYNEYGKGRTAYFAGDIDRCYWKYLATDHKKLISNTVRWGLRGEDVLVLNGSGYVDVTLWENKEGIIIHLVNMTTIHAMRGVADEIIVLKDLTLDIRNDLINNGDVKIRSLESAEDLSIERGAKYSKIKISQLKLHDVIVIK